MKPLYWIAIGLAVVVFTAAPDGAWDVAEVLGSALVLLGWWHLARAVPDLRFRLTLTYLAVLTLVVAGVLSSPDARSWLDDADPAVVWASSLPALGFQAVLAHVFAERARAARARAGWVWRAAEVAILVAIVANPLYEAAGWDWVYGAGALGLLGVLAVIVMCVVHGPARWAGAPEPRPKDGAPEPGA